MKILAVDTSAAFASVAVAEDGRLLAEYALNHGLTHSQKLVPMMELILKDLELAPRDIDLFSVSVGPGSFTGIRIGITTIKSMAYGLHKPAIGINTLDALACNIPATEYLICPVIDARNNTVYTAVYDYYDGQRVRRTDYAAVTIPELARFSGLDNRKDIRRIIFLGDAAERYKNVLTEIFGDKSIFTPANLSYPKASSVAYSAYEKARSNDSANNSLSSHNALVPFYLRKPQAEREYEKKGTVSTNGNKKHE